MEEERQQMTEKIAMAAEEAQGLLENLLRWALLQQGSLRAQPEVCSLHAQVAEVMELLRLNARVKGISLDMQVSPEFWVYADKIMLATVIRNLLSNALKYTRGPEGRVAVKAQPEGDSYLLWIVDNGIGMTADTLQKVRWKEGSSQVGTDQEQGTGLGLRLCHQFLAMHQSTLTIESAPDQGTRVGMRWQKAQTPLASVREPAGSRLPSLLIIDDDLDNQDILRIYLRGLPLQLDFANDGWKGVQTFAQKHYEVVLMDLHMPELGGVEATKRIRSLEQQLGRTRATVIAFSSSLLQEDIDAAIQAGCDAYVMKPVKKQNLLQTLRRYLQL
jgi:CheY-like chemotaxis protein